MTFTERILLTAEFYTAKAPRDPDQIFAATGLPGKISSSFIDALRDLERHAAQCDEDGDA